MSDNYSINDLQVIANVEFDGDNIEIEKENGENRIELLNSVSGKHTFISDAKTLNIHTAKSKEGVWVWQAGKVALVSEIKTTGRASSATTTQTDITPKTPGTVIRIMVKERDKVVKGQELVVVSAMKMETPLYAGFDGIVESVNTEEGANVKPGEILIDLTRDMEANND